jgi:two-component system response regulator VicR
LFKVLANFHVSKLPCVTNVAYYTLVIYVTLAFCDTNSLSILGTSAMTKAKSLTTGDIAEYCDVNLRTVIRWIDKGSLKGYKLPGRGNNRVTEENFLLFLKEYNMPISTKFLPNKKNVLIVDDDQNMGSAIKRVLRNDGFVCDTATNGFLAGSKLMQHKPSLMTLDLSMPGLNGFELVKYLRADEQFVDLKILVISALNQECLDAALALGANAIMSKPYDNDQLLDIANQLTQ